MTLTLMIVLFVLFTIVGMPVVFSLGIASMATILLTTNVPISVVVERMVLGADSFQLLAIPLFIMAASIMNRSGITDRIFSFARSIVGSFRGGLGHANVLASVFFAGASGSEVSDIASLGRMQIRAMTAQGYPKSFAAALTVASATIGPIIPPSIPLIIFGGIAGVSIGSLFLAGILPGLILALTLMVFVYYLSVRNKYPRDEKFSIKRVSKEFIKSFLPIMTPVLILGGIITGVFTPTEVAAFAVFYAFVLGFFVYRELKISMIPAIIMETISTAGVVMFILSAATAFSWVLTMEQIGLTITQWAADAGSPLEFLIMVNILLLLLGMVIETTALLVIMAPFLVPVAQTLGIDLVHFGVMIVFNLMIGLATPPIGLGLFTVSQVSDMTNEDAMKAILPFLPVLFFVLVLVMLVPALTLWIPSLFN